MQKSVTEFVEVVMNNLLQCVPVLVKNSFASYGFSHFVDSCTNIVVLHLFKVVRKWGIGKGIWLVAHLVVADSWVVPDEACWALRGFNTMFLRVAIDTHHTGHHGASNMAKFLCCVFHLCTVGSFELGAVVLQRSAVDAKLLEGWYAGEQILARPVIICNQKWNIAECQLVAGHIKYFTWNKPRTGELKLLDAFAPADSNLDGDRADCGQTPNSFDHHWFRTERRYQRVFAAIIAATNYIHARGYISHGHRALRRVVGCGLESSGIRLRSAIKASTIHFRERLGARTMQYAIFDQLELTFFEKSFSFIIGTIPAILDPVTSISFLVGSPQAKQELFVELVLMLVRWFATTISTVSYAKFVLVNFCAGFSSSWTVSVTLMDDTIVHKCEWFWNFLSTSKKYLEVSFYVRIWKCKVGLQPLSGLGGLDCAEDL